MDLVTSAFACDLTRVATLPIATLHLPFASGAEYLDSLIGPYPEAKELYRQRSPIHYVDQISCPVILFQGLEDKVVPPSQAEIMVRALEAKKLPYAYIAYEGEQHGFRKAENIQRSAADLPLF